jgi:hypothetical protein
MWPFNEELILKLAEKEWLGKTPMKQDGKSVVVAEAQKVMSALITTNKQQTPRAETKKVYYHS